MKSGIVCVTGASGFVGQSLVKRLLSQGYSVRVLTRKPQAIFPPGIDVFVSDLSSKNCELREFVFGCKVLFHCAGEVRDLSNMWNTHVFGMQRLLDAITNEYGINHNKIHVVQLSSVGVYGPTRPYQSVERFITEESELSPEGLYEITKAFADELVIRAGKSNMFTYSILRPSNVIGANMSNNSFISLVNMIDNGLFFYIGQAGAIANYVHVDDVVFALEKCGFDIFSAGQIYILSNDFIMEDLIESIAFNLKKSRPRLRIPEFPIRYMTKHVEKLIKTPLTTSRIDALVNRTRYSSDKIMRNLNFQFSVPIPQAINEIVLCRSSGKKF